MSAEDYKKRARAALERYLRGETVEGINPGLPTIEEARQAGRERKARRRGPSRKGRKK